MSEMVERAATAIWETWSERCGWDERREHFKDETRKEARAALLAALDPEDEALRKLFANMIYCCTANQDGAREAIQMLRERIAPIAQGETDGNG